MAGIASYLKFYIFATWSPLYNSFLASHMSLITFTIASTVVSLIALGLAIAGLRQEKRMKIFAYLGMIFSLLNIALGIFTFISYFLWMSGFWG